MPLDACQFFYECTVCHTVLRPKSGDCCVFCSFATVPCPPVQLQQRCCVRLVLPFTEGFDQATDQATDQADALLLFCEVPRSVKEIMQHLGLSHRPHFRDSLLRPLMASGKLSPTIPDKPSSPNQRYITVKPEVN